MSNKIYYVYAVCDINNRIVYVGKGKGKRAESHLRGNSSSASINKMYFSGEDIFVRYLKENLTNAQALVEEAKMIREYSPCCNKIIPKISSKVYLQSLEDSDL